MRKGRSARMFVVVILVAAGGELATARSVRHVVVVPRVRGKEVSAAYAQLHQAGLRVSINKGFEMSLVGQPPHNILVPKEVVSMRPAAGRRVRPGSVVTLVLRCDCTKGSIRTRRKPAYRVPDFAGRLVSAAYGWVRPKILLFVAHLGPLHAGDARTLFGNYHISRQSPTPGTMLRFANRDGRTTPLTVWGEQIPASSTAAVY